jgi:hypothetical protein
MVVYSTQCLRKVREGATAALQNLIGRNPESGTYQVKACCCCDRLLKYGECEFISKKKVKTAAWASRDNTNSNTNPNIKKYYRYQGKGTLKDKTLDDLVLSPRSFYSEKPNGSRTEGGFDICQDCNSQKDPTFCIKKYQFGSPPSELSCLNEVERAMISQGRIDRHIFQMYAGQHQCVSLWHQMHFNDCEHTLASIERLKEYQLPQIMMCTLSGPFTRDQKAIALKRVSIDLRKVKRALTWLIANNVLYKELRLPGDDEFPVPVIIDHSEMVDGTDSRIETIFKTTIIFPQTSEIHENNGGNMTKEEFLRDVMKDIRGIII